MQDQQTTTPAKGSRLGAVRAGRIRNPRRVCIYGPEGMGKTTLVANIPGAIMCDLEGGSDMVDVPRYMFRDDRLGYVARSLEEYRAAIRDLTVNPHEYKAVVTDSLDRLEHLALKYILQRDGATRGSRMTSLEDYGYGKGYQILLDEMRAVLGELDKLRNERGLDVVFTAHAVVKKFSNPTGEDYDRYQLKASEKVAGYFREWCEEIGFLHLEQGAGVSPGAKSDKAKAWSTNKRVIEFDRHAAWDAKARLPLPPRVLVDPADPWRPFEQAIEQAYNAGPEEHRKLITEQVARIDPTGATPLAAQVTAALEKAGDNVRRLALFLNELRRRDVVDTTTNQETDNG